MSSLMNALGTSAYHLSSSGSDDDIRAEHEGLRLPDLVGSPDIETGKRLLLRHESGDENGEREEQDSVAIVIHTETPPCYDGDSSGGEDGSIGYQSHPHGRQGYLPPISRVAEARKSYAMAKASNEISARFRKKNAQEILTKRLEMKKEQKASAGLSSQPQQPHQQSLSPDASQSQSVCVSLDTDDSQSKSAVRKELRKRLESNIARHRVSVMVNESSARERLERRLKDLRAEKG